MKAFKQSQDKIDDLSKCEHQQVIVEVANKI